MKSGVKPKSKSSAVLTVLLFAFLPGWAGHFATPDTLILDGEIIYIDPQEELVDTDSLEEVLKEDLYKERGSHSMAFAFLVSSDFQNTRWLGSGDLQTLDVFLGRQSSWYVRPAIDAEVILRNDKSWKLVTGLGLRYFSYSISQVEKADLSAASQRFRFENRDGELWQYSLIEVGPGFETDTTQVGVNAYRRSLAYINIPFGVRFSPEKWAKRSDWHPYFDVGINARMLLGTVLPDPDDMEVALVNESGEYRTLNGLLYEKVPYEFVPYFQAGALWQASDHWAMRCQIAIVPVRSVYSLSEYWKVVGHHIPFTLGVQWIP